MVRLQEIIYLKSFEEPWWMLDGWEREIVSQKNFSDPLQAKEYFEGQSELFSKEFAHQKSRFRAAAFWNEGDLKYCENCEEDLQVYHGLLWLEDGKLKRKSELPDFSTDYQ